MNTATDTVTVDRSLFASPAAYKAALNTPHIPWHMVTPDNGSATISKAQVTTIQEDPDRINNLINLDAPVAEFSASSWETWISDDVSPEILRQVNKEASKAFRDQHKAKGRLDHTVLAAGRAFILGTGYGLPEFTRETFGTTEYKLARTGQTEADAFRKGMQAAMPDVLGKQATDVSGKTTANGYLSHVITMGSCGVVPMHTKLRVPVTIEQKKGKDDAKPPRLLAHAEIVVSSINQWVKGGRVSADTNSFTLGGKTHTVVTLIGDHAETDWSNIRFPSLKLIATGEYDKALAESEATVARAKGNKTEGSDGSEPEVLDGLPTEFQTTLRKIAADMRSVAQLKGEAREQAIKAIRTVSEEYLGGLEDIKHDAMVQAKDAA